MENRSTWRLKFFKVTNSVDLVLICTLWGLSYSCIAFGFHPYSSADSGDPNFLLVQKGNVKMLIDSLPESHQRSQELKDLICKLVQKLCGSILGCVYNDIPHTSPIISIASKLKNALLGFVLLVKYDCEGMGQVGCGNFIKTLFKSYFSSNKDIIVVLFSKR
jgi:hypothetical protein